MPEEIKTAEDFKPPQRKYINTINLKKLNNVLEDKKPKYRKYLPLILVTLFFLVSFCITYSFSLIINNANPGDLMFSIKQLIEQSSEPENLEDKIEHRIRILDNRVQALNTLSSQNNCVQAALTEANIVNSLKSVRELTKQNGNFKSYYPQIYKTLLPISNIQSNCPLKKQTIALVFVYRYIVAEINPEEIDFDKLMSDSLFKYNEIIQQLHNTSFSNQTELNDINNALLKAENNTKMFSELSKNSDFEELNTRLFENQYIYDVVLQKLGFDNAYISQEDIVRGICAIEYKNIACSAQNLESDWNSIYSKNT